jgi:hypothetical protein
MDETDIQKTDIQKRVLRPRDKSDPLAQVEMGSNNWYSHEEAAELRRRSNKRYRETWDQTQQGRLCIAFYKAFMDYKKFMEEHPYLRAPDGGKVEYDEHKLFQTGFRLVEDHWREREEASRRNLEKAQRAARCQHVHMSGKQCGAPRVKGKKLCHMHERMGQIQPAAAFDLGPMEDPDSIQLGIRKLQSAIIEGKLDYRQVGQLAYTIQLAAWNVMRTSVVAGDE